MAKQTRGNWMGALALAAAVCAGSGLSHVGTSAMPFQVGALIDATRISASQAGLFGFVEICAYALSMILVSPWVSRLSPFAVAIAGCALILASNIGLYTLGGSLLQLALATGAGAGYGLIFAATIAGGVGADEPVRFYAIGNSAALLIVFSVISAIPAAQHQFGIRGVFASIACIALICFPFFFGFQRRSKFAASHAPAAGVRGGPGLLVCWVSISMGTGGLYAFSERIGRSIHLSETNISGVLSTGVFVGLLGTGAAVLIGSKINQKIALAVGLVGASISCLLLGYAVNLALFGAGVFAYWVFFMFLYNYMLGAAAKLDSGGRLGTLGGGLERLGYGVGVWLAGVFAEHFSYASTGLLGFVICMSGLCFGLPSVFRALDLADLKPKLSI